MATSSPECAIKSSCAERLGGHFHRRNWLAFGVLHWAQRPAADNAGGSTPANPQKAPGHGPWQNSCMAEHRAVFDFRITFANGGDITGRGFRLDVPGPDVDRSEVGVLLVRHLGLLMVDQVELDPFRIEEEPHRGGRGLEAAAAAAASERQLVDLSHPIHDGMVTYPGLPGPEITDHLTRAASEEAYGAGVTFHIGRISLVANTGTYLDTPFHRYRPVCRSSSISATSTGCRPSGSASTRRHPAS